VGATPSLKTTGGFDIGGMEGKSGELLLVANKKDGGFLRTKNAEMEFLSLQRLAQASAFF
jgi:hypothetical protein